MPEFALTSTQAIALAIAAAGGLIRGITGFGGAMVMTPPMALLLGPQTAIAVVLLLEAFAGAPMLPAAWREARWRTLAPVGLAACAAVPLGGMVLAHADPDLLRRAIAATVMVFALLLLRGARYSGRHGLPASLALGAFSGTMLGAVGMGGPPVVLYLLSGPDPVAVTRANMTLYVVLISLAGLVMLAGRGILNAGSLWIALPLVPTFVVGLLAGGRLFSRFSDQRFRQLTLLMLMAVSAGILLA